MAPTRDKTKHYVPVTTQHVSESVPPGLEVSESVPHNGRVTGGNDTEWKRVGDRVRARRGGRTQRELATAADLSTTALGEIERGERSNFSGRTLAKLEAFLVENGLPPDVGGLRREHVEAFVADQLAHWSPNTAGVRFRSLQQFFGWLVDEGDPLAPWRRWNGRRSPTCRCPW